jgi:MtN3 and saliva related transmembrane protein
VTATDLLGYVAAALTTLAFLPQALLTLRTRDVSGISLGMYGAFTLGVALWLAYGVALGEWPIIAANAVTLLLASVILVMPRSPSIASGGARSTRACSARPGVDQNGLPLRAR